MAELYWGEKKVLGIKHPGGDYIDISGKKVLKGISVVIPEGVTEIPDEAYYCLRSLCKVVIPASATSIGANSFAGCQMLTQIYFEGDPPVVQSNSFSVSSIYSPTFYYKAGNTNWTDDIKTATYGGARNAVWAEY